MQADLLLRGGHVIDPAQDLDGIMDVAIAAGRIAAVGHLDDYQAARTLDVAGKLVTPGLVDFHVHAYGTIAFRDPDVPGVYAGVTTMVDGGSAGTATFDDFLALCRERAAADVYSYVHVEPSGIPHDGDRTIDYTEIQLGRLVEIAGQHPDVVCAFKAISVSQRGLDYLRLAKAATKLAGLPLYVHIGDWRRPPVADIARQVFDMLDEGDLVIHMYSAWPNSILDKDGKLLPEVRNARERGVLFDVAHGRQNFSFKVAERAIDQGLVPDLAGTDIGIPAVGLLSGITEVMSTLLLLGFSLPETVRIVTQNPARIMGKEDQFGSLRMGMPADVTVMTVEKGDFEYLDWHNETRHGEYRITPVHTVKRGVVYDCDLSLINDPSMSNARSNREAVPEGCRALTPTQRAFLGKVADELDGRKWKPAALHARLHELREAAGLSIPEGMNAICQSLQNEPFMPQIGWYLTSVRQDFVVSRLRTVAAGAF
jgi:dihydroorotase